MEKRDREIILQNPSVVLHIHHSQTMVEEPVVIWDAMAHGSC